MIIPTQKIKMAGIKPHDWKVMHAAIFSYLQALADIYHSQQKTQQLIHYTILDALSWEIHKRIYGRKTAQGGQITLEVYNAFLLYDALSFYSNNCDSHLESAILNRLMISVHAELPRTSDGKKLSIHSNLNFNSNTEIQ